MLRRRDQGGWDRPSTTALNLFALPPAPQQALLKHRCWETAAQQWAQSQGSPRWCSPTSRPPGPGRLAVGPLCPRPVPWGLCPPCQLGL